MLKYGDKTIKLEEDRLDVTQEEAEHQIFLIPNSPIPTNSPRVETTCALASGETSPLNDSPRLITGQFDSGTATLTEDYCQLPVADHVLETSFDIPGTSSYNSPVTKSRLASAVSTRKELEKEATRKGSALVLSNFTEVHNNMPDLNIQGNKLKCASAVIVVFLAVVTGICLSALHRIEEGNVGIYFKYGALMNVTTHPGMHYMTPFVVDVMEIQIRDQTDTLPPISAITRDGISNHFNDVQVISRVKVGQLIPMVRKYGLNFRDALVNDRVKEELRIFCANHTIDDVYNLKFLEIAPHVKHHLIESIARLGNGGIEVLNLVIPKPQIPSDIANNYKQVKVQWTEQLVATQQQKTEQIKKDTEKIKAIADAERSKAVLEIQIQQQILEQEGKKNVSSIENLIREEKEKNIADIAKYKAETEAESNKALYTDQYIKLQVAKSLTENTKLYFSGENSEVGALLSKIFDKS